MRKKRILIGICSSIAAYKIPELIRQLIAENYEVRIVLTKSANHFVAPLVLQTLSNHRVYHENQISLLDNDAAMAHIELARWADIILISPASAHIIAKIAHGLADDLLTTLVLASTSPIYIAPAMNLQMWLNPITQKNVSKLLKRNFTLLGPDVGSQACGENGPGRMLEPEEIVDCLAHIQPIFKNKNILITAGPTHEAIDPIRYISNRSSGKMGYALAEAAKKLGAKVTLISGPVSLSTTSHIHVVPIKTAEQMHTAVHAHIKNHDIFISCAAVADYKVTNPALNKIKRDKDSISITLEPNQDILKSVTCYSDKTFIVGFAAETENLISNAQIKLKQKGADIIIANNVNQPDIGFDSDFNEVSIFSKNETVHLEKSSKTLIAMKILKYIAPLVDRKLTSNL